MFLTLKHAAYWSNINDNLGKIWSLSILTSLLSQADIEYLIELVVQEVDDYGNTFEFYRIQLNSTQKRTTDAGVWHL